MARNTPWKNLVAIADAVANDSNKVFTVPAGKQWTLSYIYAVLACTAVAGNRALWVLIMDAADTVIARYYGGAVLAATEGGNFSFAPGHPQETAFTSQTILRALPYPLTLPAGYQVQVLDAAAIDPTHDDLTVEMLVEEYTE